LVPWASGDLTLSQDVEGGPQKGKIVMRVKGDRLRLDLPGGQTGPMSTILNTKTGDTITLVHAKKFVIKRTGEQAKQAGGDVSKTAEPPKLTATSTTERVGEYEAEVYTMTVDGSKDTLWVVRDFPNFPAIREDLQRVSHATTAGLNRAGTLDVTTLPGMVVKRQKERGGQEMTITLKSVSRDAIEDSMFEAPAE
ncbi:MAG: DUF4412 domain-containing protein, partial [Chthoniobacteraceae bacterium]